MHKCNQDFCSWMITGDETWIIWYDPKAKQMSRLLKGLRPPVKAKLSNPLETMITLFFDSQGPYMVKFLEKWNTINSQYYANVLIKLHDFIKVNRRDKPFSGVLLLDENAFVHCAGVVLDCFWDLCWSRLNHSPYSPDLAIFRCFQI